MSRRTDILAVWLAEHPAARRTLTLVLTVHTLALWSLLNAPSAAAATGAAALGWTGLTDTDGVPLGDYFLSLVDTSEAITNNGQGIDLLDPSTIAKWMVAATQVAMTHSLAASWLTTEAAGFVFIIGIALWFLRFALSSSWLVTLAGLGRPLYDAVNNLITQMWLGPIAVTLCVTVGGLHMIRGRRGRGWAVIGSGALLTVLLLTVFRDPITDLYSDHGLLAIGRATGFQIAQAAAHNGSYAPGQSLDAQLDGLLSQLITAAARHPLQVLNFGMVVDNVGSCRGAWSAAIRAGGGDGDGPAHAMAACGAPRRHLPTPSTSTPATPSWVASSSSSRSCSPCSCGTSGSPCCSSASKRSTSACWSAPHSCSASPASLAPPHSPNTAPPSCSCTSCKCWSSPSTSGSAPSR